MSKFYPFSIHIKPTILIKSKQQMKMKQMLEMQNKRWRII